MRLLAINVFIQNFIWDECVTFLDKKECYQLSNYVKKTSSSQMTKLNEKENGFL